MAVSSQRMEGIRQTKPSADNAHPQGGQAFYVILHGEVFAISGN
ncbi:hypothetical protein [Methylomonas rhizoryzae]|nr:hypothetical protein [Methylomonas rhizoryzae]